MWTFFVKRKHEKLKKQYIEAFAKEETHKLINYLEAKVYDVRDKIVDRISKEKSVDLVDYLEDVPSREE